MTARVRTTGEPVRVIVFDGSHQSMIAVIRACDAAGWFTLESGMTLRYCLPGVPTARRAEVGEAFVVDDEGKARDVLAAGYFDRHYEVDADD
nr:hypothetical protein GCM10023233_27500 [Brevibacterium otitidis]